MKKVWLFILICLPLCFFGCQNKNKNKMGTPQNLTVETGGIITFERVAGDQYYSVLIDDNYILNISLNGANVELYKENDKNYLSFDASPVFVVGTSYKVRVRAEADGKKAGDYSNAVTYTHAVKLDIPTNVRFNDAELIWDDVAGADSYQIKIISPSGNETNTTSTNNRFAFASILTDAGNYSFSVSARNSASERSASDFSANLVYMHKVQLSTPRISSVYKQGDEVKMLAVLDVGTDEIYLNINGHQERITLQEIGGLINKLDVSNVWDVNLTRYLDQATAKQYIISVQACSQKEYLLDSDFSDEKLFIDYQQLISPTLTLDGEVLKFEPTQDEMLEIQNSMLAGYQINLALANGVKTVTNVPKNVYEFAVSSWEDVLAVSVTKIGANQYNKSSISGWLSPSEQEQQFSVQTQGANLSWTGNADYYIIEVDGKLETTTEHSLNLANYASANSCAITAVKRNYKPKTYNITMNFKLQLPSPTIGYMQGFDPTQPYLLQFTAVDNALGYFVYLKLDSNDDLEFHKIDHLFTSTKIDLSNYITHSDEYGQYLVKLQAVADGYEIYGNFVNSPLTDSLVIQHKRALSAPQFADSPVTKTNGRYYLNFTGVPDAYSYQLLINSNLIEIANSSTTYSYDITNYLHSAGKYTFRLRSIKNPADTFVDSSSYVEYEYSLFLQLNMVHDIEIVENEGKYSLTFGLQNNASEYRVRIVNATVSNYQEYLASQSLANPFTITQPSDISRYVALEGEYYIYVTAIASPGSFYSDSLESSEYAYLNKLSSLSTPTNLMYQNVDKNTFNLTWGEVSNADYYTIRVANTYGEIKEINSFTNQVNISSFITVPGQYSASVKAVVESESENSNKFVSSSYSVACIIDYDFTEDWDFLRSPININNSSYDYQIENVENLVYILWYHYIFDINNSYGLKLKIQPNQDETTKDAIMRFADEASSYIYNFNEDQDYQDLIENNFQESELFSHICACLLKAYPEYNVLQDFSCESVSNGVYKLLYSNALKQLETNNDSILLPTKNYGDSFSYLSAFIRRGENTPFAVDQNPEMYVTTSEQLLVAVTNGFKPNFVKDSKNAEQIYNNAKAVLRSIVRANMTDYEKVNVIFNWLEYAYNLNYYATYVNNQESSDVSAFGNRYDFYLESAFLNISNPANGGFDGEFYLGNGIATSFSYAKAFSLLCGIEGIKTSLVYGSVNTNQMSAFKEKTHVWNKVYLSTNDGEKKWYVVDLTYSDNVPDWNNLSASVAVSSHMYFLVTDSFYQSSMSAAESKINSGIACNTNFDYYQNTAFGLNETQIEEIQQAINLGQNPTAFRYFSTFDPSTHYQAYSTGFGEAQAFMFNAIVYAKYKQKFVNDNNLAMFEIKVATNLISDNTNLNRVLTSINNIYLTDISETMFIRVISAADSSQNATTFVFTIEKSN